MSRGRLSAGRRGAATALLAAVIAAVALVCTGVASADTLVSQPVLGAPATGVTPFGAAPAEDGGTWAFGTPIPQPALVGDQPLTAPPLVTPAIVLLRAGADGIWRVVDVPRAADGTALTSFRPATGSVSGTRLLSAQMTARGGGVLIGTADPDQRQLVLVRDPGGTFREITTPVVAADGPDPDEPDPVGLAGARAAAPTEATTPAGTTTTATTATATTATPPTTTATTPAPRAEAPATAVLEAGEQLYAQTDSRMPVAPLDEGPRTGVLLAPAAPAGRADAAVLHWDGERWTREQIVLPSGVDDLHVIALAAVSADDAWLLASSSRAGLPVMLFRRQAATADDALPTWVRVTDPGSPLLGPATRLPSGTTVAAVESGQPLTATAHGVFVDGTVAVGGAQHDLTFFFAAAGTTGGAVAASWCTAAAGLCSRPLDADRSAREYRAVAWAGSDGDPAGTRITGGYGEGKLLRLDGSGAELVLGAGRALSANGAIAFAAPDDGWVGGEAESLTHVTTRPALDTLQSWPVPFRQPLLAVTSQPGAAAGAIGSGALAVGDDGQVARYVPGGGWRAEYLLDGNDERATPRLRAVAWPRDEIAFAVGDDGAMWRWRQATDLWEADPGVPLNFDAHLMGIAFDPANPDRGYAVGKAGTLLRYEKSWERDVPPAGLEQAQFTSLAFAGSQAVAAYRTVDPTDSTREIGGIVVNDGTGWRIDEQFAQLLASVPVSSGVNPVPRKVAGLPDGGAAVAAIGVGSVVIERDGPAAPWRFSSAPLAGARDIAALAAIRDGDRVRALVSVDSSGQAQAPIRYFGTDARLSPPPEGAPPFLVSPDPLPALGLLVRETAGGWRDEQHAAFPMWSGDAPVRPDAALAMSVSPSGDAGWVVGGETGVVVGSGIKRDQQAIQTGGVMRYPGDAQAPQGTQSTPIDTPPGQPTFAIGGGSRCADLCAPLANSAIGPDRWLPSAIGRAAGIGGVRAFLYTGGRLADRAAGATAAARAQELQRYAQLLGTTKTLPVFAAAAPADADASGSTEAFRQAFAGFSAPFGTAPEPDGIGRVSSSIPDDPTRSYYSFDSLAAGQSRPVRVFVLDYSGSQLGVAQTCWLARGLGEASAAGAPAIVIGSRPLTPAADGVASDATTVAGLLAAGVAPSDCGAITTGRASAYFYDGRGRNRYLQLSASGGTLDTWGSGTLGYVGYVLARGYEDFTASGFLLASVDLSRYDAASNTAPVSAKLIPNISELALDATDGTHLRRSEPALFDALARRPRGGYNYTPGSVVTPDPYVAIPSRCVGRCNGFVRPEYEFRSSRPDIGDFVRQDPDSPDDHAVLLGADDKPIADAASGLFCPYNAGTTTISIRAGGLVFSQVIRVEQGSVRRPCGTVPLVDPPAPQPGEAPIPGEEPAPDPGGQPQPNPVNPNVSFDAPPPPPPPVKPAPVPRIPAPRARAITPPVTPVFVPPFLVQLPNGGFLPPVIQPPPPPAARPSPPSGTSPVSAQVTQTAVAPEEKREEEVATDMAHNMAAYEQPGRDRFPGYLAGLALLAAIAGATIRRGRTRDGETLAISAARSHERRR